MSVKPNNALLCSYLAISHVLKHLDGQIGQIGKRALEAALEGIREAFTGNPDDLRHERDELEYDIFLGLPRLDEEGEYLEDVEDER